MPHPELDVEDLSLVSGSTLILSSLSFSILVHIMLF